MVVLKTDKKQGKRSVIIWVFGAIVFIVVFYLLFLRSEVVDIGTDFISSGEIPNINTGILEQEVLDNFKSWRVIPIIVGPTGKTNPFSQ